jgi:dimeric dUTPase (all-alpha-NTP-PPase superfamily)
VSTFETETQVSREISGLRLMRRLLLALVVGFVVLAGVNGWAHWRVGGSLERAERARTEFCSGLHLLNVTLDRMIADGRTSLEAYLDDGTITRAQYVRELERIRGQRDALGGADCPPR